MATTAKFPTALLATSDVGGEVVNFGVLVLSGAHTNVVATVTLTVAVPVTWPTIGFVTIDTEVIKYTGVAAATLTGCTRGFDGTTAASHLDGASVEMDLNALRYNQILVDLIATQAVLGSSYAGPQPNLVSNSDFARRTVLPGAASSAALAMPEVFTDLSGWTKIDAGAAGSVAANIFTQGAAFNEYASQAGSFVWRDGRASATFKATAIAGIYQLNWRIDANNKVVVQMNAGNLFLSTVIANVPDNTTTVAQVLTLNRWYWLEIEKQGTTWIGKVYDTGGTASGVTKASSTLLQTLTKNTASAALQVGAHVSILGDQAASQWGGIAASPGGIYVEIPMPESWAVTFGGTIGGQSIGIDELADSGPFTKQKVPVVYIPATSRTATLVFSGPDGQMNSAAVYTASYYEKNTGLGGSGVMVRAALVEQNSAQATQATTNIDDAAETVYTRKSASVTTNAATRRFAWQYLINPSSTRTGTVRFLLAQLEQGTVATAWRNAPGDSVLPFALPYKFLNWTTPLAITWTDAPIQACVLMGATTFTFTGTLVASLQLHLIQDQTGTRVPTFPTNVKWPSGTVPTWSTVAGKRDIVTLIPTGDFIQATAVIGF